jgi:hypothetical protein
MDEQDDVRPLAAPERGDGETATPERDATAAATTGPPSRGRGGAGVGERSPAEVALLVVFVLVAAGLAGAGTFVWFTRLHPPFGVAPWLLGVGTLVAVAGIATWAEATRAGTRPPRWVLAVTLAACAVAVPLALSSALDDVGAARRVGTVIAGLLLVALLPLVTGLAADRTRQLTMPWLPSAAVVGGAAIGAAIAVTVAVLEAPEFPDGGMQEPTRETWEQLHAAGTVEFQSLRRTEAAGRGPARASARGVLDLDEHRASITQDVGTADVATQEVDWDPDEPWTAVGPVERLWRSLVGVAEWEQVSGGWQGVVDQRRITATRIAEMGSLRDRVGARWHMGEGTDGSVMTVLVQVDDAGFPTRLVTRERDAGSPVEVTTTTTFRG